MNEPSYIFKVLVDKQRSADRQVKDCIIDIAGEEARLQARRDLNDDNLGPDFAVLARERALVHVKERLTRYEKEKDLADSSMVWFVDKYLSNSEKVELMLNKQLTS